MELIYTNQLAGFEPGKRYRDARLFRGVERDATEVVVVGDHPEIVAAYNGTGIEVTVKDAPKAARASDLNAESSEALRRELASIGMMVEGFAGGDLVHPGGGDTALRLYEVFEVVNGDVESLRAERDGEAEKVERLNKEVAGLLAQIESLKAGSGGAEVDELKAKLTAAGVSFRANASKESLEKLVAELPKE